MHSALLGELCILRGGSAFPKEEQGSKAGIYPFVKVSDLALPDNGNTLSAANHWISEVQRLRLRPSIAPAGSVLFAKIGVGLLAERMSVATQATAFDNNMMAATPIADACYPGFLPYLLTTLNISSYAVGSALPYLKQSTLVAIPCVIPELPGQRAIAEVLGALDDKIAANASLICTADELAAVRFQALVAEGAEGRPLSSLAQFVNGKAFTKGASGTGRVVIRIAELNSGLGNSTVYNDIDVADHHLARPGDLLFAWSGSLTVHRWYRSEGIVNQHIFKVIPSTAPLWVVNGALRRKLAEFKGIAADKATTMGHIQRHHLDEEVLIPTLSTINENDDAMTALWDRALQAERESLHLEELRDTLLPHLMSGHLPVKDAEQVVGEVV